MLILDTLEKPTIWGASRLSKFGANPLNAPIGSLYTLAGNEDLSCTVLSGEFIGQRLYDVYRENHARFGYERFSAFPLLIGFVDASDNLSIQIHPGDAYAAKHEHAEFGKTESWLFLEAPESGAIVNGCACASMEELREKVAQSDWEGIYGYLPVGKGDYVFVEAGTLHALSAGSLVYEIQQSTDVTYRFYDYGRQDAQGKTRPLQLEAAMECVDVTKKSTAIPYANETDYDHPYYSTRRQKVSGGYENPHDTFVCMTLLEGQLDGDGIRMTAGMSALILPHEKAVFAGSADVMLARPL